jgi:hypothetical protein
MQPKCFESRNQLIAVVLLLCQIHGLACFLFSSSNPRFSKNLHQSDSIGNGRNHGLLSRLETEIESNAQNGYVDKNRAKPQRLVSSRAHANFAVGDFVLDATRALVKLPKLITR